MGAMHYFNFIMRVIGGALIVSSLTYAAVVNAQDGSGEKAKVIRTSTLPVPVSGATTVSVDVYLDEEQVNAFSEFKSDSIVINVPFRELTKVFKVKIVNRQSGETQFEGAFQFAHSQTFDTVEANGSFQTDIVYRAHSNARPRPEEFDRQDTSFDFRGDGKVTVARGRWRAWLDGEVTGTDDGNKRLRQNDGRKQDLTRGIGVIEFRDGGTFVQGSLGDVSVEPGMELVNQGFASRGFNAIGSFFNERVKVTGGNTHGADIRGTFRGVEAFDTENRRSAVNISAGLLNSENLNVTVLGSVLDVRRPGAANFGQAEVLDGEENTVLGGGLKVAAWENRIQFSGEFAHSIYANPAELNSFNEFGASVDVGSTVGDAQTYRTDVELWRGDTLSVRSHGSYSLVDALFRSVQSGTTADRETWDYGLTATYDFVSLTVGKNKFDNNVDDITSILKTRQRTYSGSLDFTLDSFKEPPKFAPEGQPGNQGGAEKKEDGFWSALRQLIPNSVSFSRSDARVESLNANVVGSNSSIDGSEIPATVTVTNGVSFNWNYAVGSTSIALTESQLDTQQTGRASADTEDRSVSLDQSFNMGPMTTSLRLALGEFENSDIASKSVRDRREAGVTVRVALEKLPVMSAGFDLSQEKERFLVDNNDAVTNTWRANASLDFSQYIPKLDDRAQPYLTLNFTTDETDSRNPNVPAQTVRNYAGTIAFGFRY